MKIEFDTATVTEAEAGGLVAMLMAIHGPVVINRYEAPAPDGYPTISPALVSDPTVPVVVKAADGYPVNPADPLHQHAGVSPAPDRDSAGIPWDERIHASTKTQTANGQWTRRRNTPDELFNSVMAELRAANTARTVEAAAGLAGNVAAGVPAVPAVPAAPTSSIPAVPSEPTAAEAFTPPASVVIPPAVPVPPVAEAVPTFLQIMQTVTAAQREAKLDKAKLDELLASCNMDGVAKLVSADEGTRSAFSALLSAHLA